MKKMSRLILALLLAMTLAACGAENNETKPVKDSKTEQTQTPKKQEAKVEIKILKGDDDLVKEKSIAIEKDDILMDVLKENFEIKEEKGFITSIEGIQPEKGEENKIGWMYYVNDEMAQVGAADYKLQPGDQVSFKYEKF